ncbi:hypothetical protein FOPPYZMZ_CDS0024 [Pseudomonas phage 9Ps-7B]|uniref:Uncharacterized protein n=2 Tax=root TaxID=1 RepID=A0AAU8KUS3_9VIRU|nr:hypothetical protein IPCDMZAV_CDS0347 [Pseudomonas phage 6B]WRQ05957.1 hypothetical protein QAMIJHJT_CDS0025 [Pseudomonas phage 9-Ps-8B]WRQ06365.1 hypothetical protein FOPPYZMZ_CDS0024 [Pseudomonas phage 9Ps-7B]WRQ07126.1 hypothetical protein ZBUARNPM_CDS0377 [Pseudomonas phage 14Ps5-6]
MIYLGWFTIIFITMSLCLFYVFCYRSIHESHPGVIEKQTTRKIVIWAGILLMLAYLNEISRVFIVGVVT